MENISKKSILETVDTASAYAAKLEQNLNCVLGAEKQVVLTSEESLNEIDAAFDDLTKSVLDALNKRRETLKNAVSQIQEEGLVPLRACRQVIKQALKQTQSYICEGQDLLQQCQNEQLDVNRCLTFFDQSSLLGNLPAVPNLEEVPAITFQMNVDAVRAGLVGNLLSLGSVSRMGPVQISSVTERPGALLVQWEEVDDRAMDQHNFRLQVALGSHPNPLPRLSTAVYRDVYVGSETSCMVRDLKAGAQYTLRVNCGDDFGGWCAWSLPRVASTSLTAFRWSSNNPHYSTSVEGKIATKNDKSKSILLSSMKQFGPDHSIEFTVLDCPEARLPCEGMGIVDTLEATDSLIQNGCLFLNSQGCIFVDGVEKTTRLPALEKGSKVTFTCDPLKASRVRVHIDSGDKAVTYDWRVSSTFLHFGTLCFQPGWKLMVE